MATTNFKSAGYGWTKMANSHNKDCIKPNRLVLEDWTQINLGGVAAKGNVNGLMNLHAKKRADITEEFKQYIM
jgi:hypothetical protein